MIQRIQSVFLLLAFLLNTSIFFNALYSHAMSDPQEWIGIGFTVVLALSALGSLGCIFLYSNRPNQIKWVNWCMVVQIVAIGYSVGIFISLGGFGMYLWDEAIGVAILLIALLAQLYARKKIRDDEELVKSMDRIR